MRTSLSATRARTLLLLASSLFCCALTVGASDFGETAMLVLVADQQKLDAGLIKALGSTDPNVRIAAIRVAIVRNRTAVLPRIREMLESEPDINVARELVRGGILLGGTTLVTEALETSARFDHRLDTSVAVSVARLGADQAIPLYFSELHELKAVSRTSFFRVALWGRPDLVTPTAARVLSLENARAWASLTSALVESSIAPGANVLRVALEHPDEEIREATVKLVLDLLCDPYFRATDEFGRAVLERGDVERREPPGIAFRRELARRILGSKSASSDDWLLWIATEEGSALLRDSKPLLNVLSNEEAGAILRRDQARSAPLASQKVGPPAFFTPSVLPTGLSAAVLKQCGCRAEWIGLGTVAVDRQGRVQTLDLRSINTDYACLRALEAILRLSLVYNLSINSPMTTSEAVFVKPAHGNLCLDEGPVPSREEADFDACVPYRFAEDAPGCTPPIRKTQLRRYRSGGDFAINGFGEGTYKVEVEALISETGCVREARLLEQSPRSGLNGAALFYTLEREFTPATVNGTPVPVLYRITWVFQR